MTQSLALNFKLRVLLAYFAAYAIFYIFPNLFPISPPTLLPLCTIDSAVSFLPWTFLIYTSDYFLVLAVILIHPTIESFRALTRQAFLALFICGAFFILYPTTYLRPHYPPSSNFLVAAAMSIVGWADTPNNCFPSMHVALTGIATWTLRSVRPKAFPWFMAWTIAICASTLTTKQHYFLDIIGGILVVVFVTTVHWLVVERFQLHTQSRFFSRY